MMKHPSSFGHGLPNPACWATDILETVKPWSWNPSWSLFISLLSSFITQMIRWFRLHLQLWRCQQKTHVDQVIVRFYISIKLAKICWSQHANFAFRTDLRRRCGPWRHGPFAARKLWRWKQRLTGEIARRSLKRQKSCRKLHGMLLLKFESTILSPLSLSSSIFIDSSHKNHGKTNRSNGPGRQAPRAGGASGSICQRLLGWSPAWWLTFHGHRNCWQMLPPKKVGHVRSFFF